MIEAVEYKGSASQQAEIVKWMRLGEYNSEASFSKDTFPMIIKTLEGDMVAEPGDFIIKGIRGEFYPCKPDIFWQTYEAI